MPHFEKQRDTQPCGAAGRVSPGVEVTRPGSTLTSATKGLCDMGQLTYTPWALIFICQIRGLLRKVPGAWTQI